LRCGAEQVLEGVDRRGGDLQFAEQVQPLLGGALAHGLRHQPVDRVDLAARAASVAYSLAVQAGWTASMNAAQCLSL
jgi:hypothetical protein